MSSGVVDRLPIIPNSLSEYILPYCLEVLTGEASGLGQFRFCEFGMPGGVLKYFQKNVTIYFSHSSPFVANL